MFTLHLCYVSVSYMWFTTLHRLIYVSQFHVVHISIYVTFQSVHIIYKFSYMWFTLFTFMLRFSQLHVVHIIFI